VSRVGGGGKGRGKRGLGEDESRGGRGCVYIDWEQL